MTDPTNLPRLYGEKEIGQILKRATELQHAEPPAPSAANSKGAYDDVSPFQPAYSGSNSGQLPVLFHGGHGGGKL